MSKSKYHAVKVTDETGQAFDSKHELARYRQLKLLEQAGEITNLRRQVPFELIPTQREPDTTGPRGGVRRGKLLERPVRYIADFVYDTPDGQVVEDAKGMRTEAYRIKRKLMLLVHHIHIKET